MQLVINKIIVINKIMQITINYIGSTLPYKEIRFRFSDFLSDIPWQIIAIQPYFVVQWHIPDQMRDMKFCINGLDSNDMSVAMVTEIMGSVNGYAKTVGIILKLYMLSCIININLLTRKRSKSGQGFFFLFQKH